MENWVGNSMCNWVGHCHRMSNSMGNWMSNNSWMSNSHWMSNSMNNRASNKSWVSDGMSNRMCDNSCLDNSRSILRNSLVGYILNNTISIVSILDCLNSTIRKSDSVTTGGGVTISVLSLLEVSSTVVIINTILICIYWGFR